MGTGRTQLREIGKLESEIANLKQDLEWAEERVADAERDATEAEEQVSKLEQEAEDHEEQVKALNALVAELLDLVGEPDIVEDYDRNRQEHVLFERARGLGVF